jgi:DNA-binding helix-hairpin-helix protein with protein kinase domain
MEIEADVNRSSVLRVPGFGEVMTRKLMDWRQKHEARFRYVQTANDQDVADERALRIRSELHRKSPNRLRQQRAMPESFATKSANNGQSRRIVYVRFTRAIHLTTKDICRWENIA